MLTKLNSNQSTEMASNTKISTHVLDTSLGRAASGIHVTFRILIFPFNDRELKLALLGDHNKAVQWRLVADRSR